MPVPRMRGNTLARALTMRRPLALLTLTFARRASPATRPAGCSETAIAGLSCPTSIAPAPAGRIFICVHVAAVRVINNDARLATHVFTFTFNPTVVRGILGVAINNDFLTNRYV